MRTPASIAGHPLHAMLIVFPVGLLVFSLICDLISLASSDRATWATVARYTMAGGFIGALVVAVPGLIDLRSIADAKVKKIAVMHMSLNLLAVVLYAINLWLRFHGSENTGTPLVLSIVSVLMLSVSGWLGAEMVHVHGVGVSTGQARQL